MKITEKVKCTGCEREYEITYDHRNGLPHYCTLCGYTKLEVLSEKSYQGLINENSGKEITNYTDYFGR